MAAATVLGAVVTFECGERQRPDCQRAMLTLITVNRTFFFGHQFYQRKDSRRAYTEFELNFPRSHNIQLAIFIVPDTDHHCIPFEF